MSAPITTFLGNKVIESVWKNDNVLCIRCIDGTEVHIVWADESGQAIGGEPKVVWHGRHVIANTQQLGAIGQEIRDRIRS